MRGIDGRASIRRSLRCRGCLPTSFVIFHAATHQARLERVLRGHACTMQGRCIAVRQLHIAVTDCAFQRIGYLCLMTRKGASTWCGADRLHEQRYAAARSVDDTAFFLCSFPFRQAITGFMRHAERLQGVSNQNCSMQKERLYDMFQQKRILLMLIASGLLASCGGGGSSEGTAATSAGSTGTTGTTTTTASAPVGTTAGTSSGSTPTATGGQTATPGATSASGSTDISSPGSTPGPVAAADPQFHAQSRRPRHLADHPDAHHHVHSAGDHLLHLSRRVLTLAGLPMDLP